MPQAWPELRERRHQRQQPDNAFIEAFNARLRAECLNADWFLCLADAAEKLEAWHDYNEHGYTAPSGTESAAALMKRLPPAEDLD